MLYRGNMNKPENVERKDIHVYENAEHKYRAYVKYYAHLYAFGHTENEALNNLGKLLSKYDIPFNLDWDDLYVKSEMYDRHESGLDG